MVPVKKFDLLTFPFKGCSLIEASAGTGKTYTIIMLYLRLLLGIHDCHLLPLTIKKILLVTFTKTATEELRERIRKNIHEFRLVCMIGVSKISFFSELLSKIDNVDLACRQLLEAEKNIDSAQIFTIHGFCQRILNMCPIELHSIFQYKILKDEEVIFRKSCNDFWRRYFYPLPMQLTSIVKEYWNDPGSLFKEIRPYLYNQEINIQPMIHKEDIIGQHKDIINYINYVKNIWKNGKNLVDILDKFPLNRRVYNKKNLKSWFKNINSWVNEETIKNYKIPKELKRFRYSTIFNGIDVKDDQVSQYALFKIIENLFRKILSLKQLIFNMAIREVRNIAKNVKNLSSEISFNDLISLLDYALQHPNTGKKLAELICEHYPVAIIDEFQDTDFYQYRIFQTLYSLCQSQYGLLLIGDPKQSIYSFRGADVFSYLLARKNIDFHYTLDINWRSSKGMVNAVNTLFQFNSSSPFIFQNIPFIPTNAAKNNKKSHLVVSGKLYPALHFCLPSYSKLTLNEYQKIIAYQCAYEIYDLLNGAYHNKVWLQNRNTKKLLQASDIVILVRDRNEGCLISSILAKFDINSVYLSNLENIFKTKEANDILLILQAILSPENSSLLRCALMTDIIGYDAKKIDSINRNEEDWKKEVDNFVSYYLCWEKYNLQTMLQEIIFRRCTLKNFVCTREGERRLINILHLGELLQKKSTELYNKHSIIYWLSTKINASDISSDDESLRVQPFDHRLIRILTIHKAKGLEFPLVFLPFIPSVRERKYPLFHDRENYQVHLDLNASLKNFHFSEEERLSEDLRLFYVAITRAIYYCFVGIGAIFFKKSSFKNHNSDLHRTALGHLLQNGVPGDFEFLKECLKKLIKYADGDIVCNFIVKDRCYQPSVEHQIVNDNDHLKKNFYLARDWKVSINTLHKITSYTELHRFSALSSISSLNLKFKNIINFENNKIEKYDLISCTPHTFPRGNISGIFLHHIFAKWNFREKISEEWLIIKLNKSGINLIWLPMLERWMNMVVNTPLDGKDLMLSKLSFRKRNSELQFYLSINKLVSSEEFDKICKNYDPISRLSSNLKFPNILGMLHGFIDLVFFWQGKYYLSDYKSTWLGETYDSYMPASIKKEMIIQHYALQYQIYTVALHRFLRYKLVQYDYEKNFGGVYYLFLRGIDIRYPGYGVYFCRPEKLLIDELDQLFSLPRTFI